MDKVKMQTCSSQPPMKRFTEQKRLDVIGLNCQVRRSDQGREYGDENFPPWLLTISVRPGLLMRSSRYGHRRLKRWSTIARKCWPRRAYASLSPQMKQVEAMERAKREKLPRAENASPSQIGRASCRERGER